MWRRRCTSASPTSRRRPTCPRCCRRSPARFPAAQLKIVCDLSPVLVRRLLAGELDLALAVRHGAEPAAEPVLIEDLVWIAAAGRPPPAARPLPLAVNPEGCTYRARALDALARTGRDWRVVYESRSPRAIDAGGGGGPRRLDQGGTLGARRLRGAGKSSRPAARRGRSPPRPDRRHARSRRLRRSPAGGGSGVKSGPSFLAGLPRGPDSCRRGSQAVARRGPRWRRAGPQSPPLPISTSRLPTWFAGLTTPSASICSMIRAARL